MYYYKNQKRYKKNKLYSQILTGASFAVLIAGAFLAFSEEYFTYSFVALMVGVVMSQLSITMTTKWGREPANDFIFNVKLKGLSDNFSIYHYMDPVDHLLVGSGGAFILMPFFQGGIIGYDEKKGRWTQKKALLFMKMFGQESIGRPDLECAHAIELVDQYFESLELDFPKDMIRPVLVFINPKAEIDPEANFPHDTIPLDKIKDLIRRYAKDNPLPADYIDEITDKLPLDDIV